MQTTHGKSFRAFAAGAFALVAAAGLALIGASAGESQIIFKGCRLIPPDTGFHVGSKEAGVATEDEKLLVALPLVNLADVSAQDVLVTGITLGGQQLLKPASLPFSLGEIPPGKDTVLQLAFQQRGLVAGVRYALKLQGTFVASRTVQRFDVERMISLPGPDEGERASSIAIVQALTVENGNFPANHAGIKPEEINEFEDRRPLPEGKRIGIMAPENPSLDIQWSGRTFGIQSLTPQVTGPPVTLVRSGTDERGGGDTTGASVDIPRPIGPPTRFVFLAGNSYALLSVDGGATFTRIDPTTVFPSLPKYDLPDEDIGICCDQNVVYIPSINRIVWQLLTRGSVVGKNKKCEPFNGYNRLRIATASPQQLIASGGRSWRYWDMTTKTFSFTQTAFLDYPDITYSDNFLHISVNRVGPGQGGLFVMRIPLSEVKEGPTIHIGFTNPADDHRNAEGGRLTHDVPDGAYWFGHVTTSQLRIFEWLDNANTYTSRVIPIGSWTEIVHPDGIEGISPTPSIYNWLHLNIRAVRGATFQSSIRASVAGQITELRRIVIAWNAGRSPFASPFPHPYVRLVPVTKTQLGGAASWGSEASSQIWNPNFAYQSAHLATNSNGDIGVSLNAGGGSLEATPVAGFLGEQPVALNGSTVSFVRFNDYTAIRRHWPNTNLFLVSDLFLLKQPLTKPTKWVHQYRLFGRTADVGSTN